MSNGPCSFAGNDRETTRESVLFALQFWTMDADEPPSESSMEENPPAKAEEAVITAPTAKEDEDNKEAPEVPEKSEPAPMPPSKEDVALDEEENAGSRKRKPEDYLEEDEPRKAAKTSETDGEESSKQPQVTYMLKDGKLRKDGKIEGATLHVQGKNAFTVESGEAIVSLRLANPEATESTPHPALVVGFYSSDEGKNFTIRVRWLITAEELEELPEGLPWKGLPRDDVIKEMGEHDVVLSPQVDDLPVESIIDKASVKLHSMYDDDNSPRQNKVLAADVPPGTLTCQYQLKFDVDSIHLDYVRLGTVNDLEGTASRLNLSSVHGSHSSIDTRSYNGAQVDSSDEEGEEVTDEDEKRVVAEGEGSNLRTSIAVGSNFQANVPPFQPNAAHTVSRRPAKVVWKPGKISEERVAEFLDAAAKILNEYLKKNQLTSNDPYTPIPTEAAEKIMKENPEEGFLTGSSLSTGFVLNPLKQNTLLKECDIDRLMERLWDCDGDVSRALLLVKQEPTRFVCTWAPFEKDLLNENFRRHHGAIRKIAKAVAPFKVS